METIKSEQFTFGFELEGTFNDRLVDKVRDKIGIQLKEDGSVRTNDLSKNDVAYFVEEDDQDKNSFKSGRLEIRDFWKWLADKEKIYDELFIFIVKSINKQEVTLT